MATILNTFLPKGSTVGQDTTALPTEVLSGKTFISKTADGQSLRTGLMMNHGSSNLTITSNAGATIPEGYYNGSGMASINLSLDDKTLASAGNVLSGKSAFTNTGTRLDGTMVNRGAKNYTITTSAGVTIEQGYHNGSGKVNLNLTLTSGKTAAGDPQILSGYQAFSSTGAQISGTMPVQGAWAATISPGGSVTVPNGWHSGAGKVTASNKTLNDCLTLDSGEEVYSKAVAGGVSATYTVPTAGLYVAVGMSTMDPSNSCSISVTGVNKTIGVWNNKTRIGTNDSGQKYAVYIAYFNANATIAISTSSWSELHVYRIS